MAAVNKKNKSFNGILPKYKTSKNIEIHKVKAHPERREGIWEGDDEGIWLADKRNFFPWWFSCGLTIKNPKLKNSSGHGPGKKNLQQKQNKNDFRLISPILEENTKKIKNSEILKSNLETSESDPTNDPKKILDLQTTSTDHNPEFLADFLSTCRRKKLIPKFLKKIQKSQTKRKK